jgi:hypothetical protein
LGELAARKVKIEKVVWKVIINCMSFFHEEQIIKGGHSRPPKVYFHSWLLGQTTFAPAGAFLREHVES